MKLSQVTPSIVRDTWTHSALPVAFRPFIADVLSDAMAGMFAMFEESLVLARAFLTIPYRLLPPRQQAAALTLATSVHLESLLGPSTPVLCLLASGGEIPAWNDPKSSRGHVAIPLLSDDFVASIPMISRLLKELGLPLSWVQDTGAATDRQMFGAEVGVFLVADAASALDDRGRQIIPAQDFVAAHSVRSVFAVGGMVFGGTALILVFFSRDTLDLRTARAFMPLVNQIKGLCIARCSVSHVFSPESAASSGGPPGGAPRGGNP